MADLAKVGDPVSCPVCGITSIVNGSHDTFLDSQPVALVGVSRTACSCSSVIVSGLVLHQQLFRRRSRQYDG